MGFKFIFHYFISLLILDTVCGTPASGTVIGGEAKAVGTYTNYDHIIIPGGNNIMNQSDLK